MTLIRTDKGITLTDTADEIITAYKDDSLQMITFDPTAKLRLQVDLGNLQISLRRPEELGYLQTQADRNFCKWPLRAKTRSLATFTRVELPVCLLNTVEPFADTLQFGRVTG